MVDMASENMNLSWNDFLDEDNDKEIEANAAEKYFSSQYKCLYYDCGSSWEMQVNFDDRETIGLAHRASLKQCLVLWV